MRPDQSSQGRMVTSQWRTWKSDQYYFTSNGAAAKNQRVGLYYVNANGVRVKNTWKGQPLLWKYRKSSIRTADDWRRILSYFEYEDVRKGDQYHSEDWWCDVRI